MLIKILVLPCGSEIGLEIHNALKYAKNIQLFGASSVSDHGQFVYQNYIENLPQATDDDFIEKVNEAVMHYNIQFIFPAHDSVVLALAKNEERLQAKVITSEKHTCEICREKRITYKMFEKYGITPHLYSDLEPISEYPVFVKPNVGQGSAGAYLAENEEALNFYRHNIPDLLIMEYLPGKEYTVDCFTDKEGILKFIGTRNRKRIKNGISVRSETLSTTSETANIAHIINKELKLRGAWFFQLKQDKNGQLKLLEIAPRIAGTMNLYRNKGVNLALLSIWDRLGYSVNVINNPICMEVDRALINRFFMDYSYDNVFIDFDDTVANYQAANPYVMMFIYQCIEKGKSVYLITKHEKNIFGTLKKLKIDKNIFKKIICLKKEENKYAYLKQFITNKKSIFIDDSFAERRIIAEKLQIPVFDVDAVESLIDWRK